MIDKYKKFLEKDNIRRDEWSHLNDKINNHDVRNFSTYDDDDDEYLKDEWSDDDIEYDDMQHILYLLRTMFKNSGINAEIKNNGLDITVYCVMSYKERLKDVINVFSIANKLKNDILPQYECEFDMYSTKKGSNILTFSFYYDDGIDNDTPPF